MATVSKKVSLPEEFKVVSPELYARVARRTGGGSGLKDFKSRVRDAFPTSQYDVDDLKTVLGSIDDSPCEERKKCSKEAIAELKAILDEIIERRSSGGADVRPHTTPKPRVKPAKGSDEEAPPARVQKRKGVQHNVIFDNDKTFNIGYKGTKRTYVATFACTTCGKSVETEPFRKCCRCFDPPTIENDNDDESGGNKSASDDDEEEAAQKS